ncbi:hypothetical protein RDWZM_002486 [Blomia tropicalis]|uniref:Uncharacterized protein n=1 Tax=Blomia tropicalis TaxID=40697 RepID=A0A9Q0RRN3_BLOTA|nr:hypothetical protein RDWZM_002486 [Blomia tropicalis]
MAKNFTKYFFDRQVGSDFSRAIHSNNKNLPESTFDALEPSTFYHFNDRNSTYESPPLTLTLLDNRIISANDTGDVVILDKYNLNECHKFNAHHSAIFDLKWRPTHTLDTTEGCSFNNTHILTSSGDRSIALWDIERTDSPIIEYFSAHHGSVKTISFHDYNLFASGGRDGSIKFWDLRSNTHAMKCGPEFCLDDPHIHQLPSVKSPRSIARRSRMTINGKRVSINNQTRQYSPILSSNAIRRNVLPSNVVTCVAFNPILNNQLFSSGISDSTIKVWDIRRSRRQFQCSSTPHPVKYYSMRRSDANDRTIFSSASSIHGYSTFIFSHLPKLGNVLLASATDSKVYAFTNQSQNPILIFSGRFSNNFSRISMFGESYLLGGANNGRILIWNCNYKKVENDNIQIRFPSYQLKFQENEDTSLVVGDFSNMSIYTTSDSQRIFKWNFAPSPFNEPTIRHQLMGDVPVCQRFPIDSILPTVSKQIQSLHVPKISHSNTQNVNVGKKQPPLTITNWMSKSPFTTSKCQNQNTTPQSLENNSKTSLTVMNNENVSKLSKSTSSKNEKQSRGIKRSHSRRNLFSNNRKISEFFRTP